MNFFSLFRAQNVPAESSDVFNCACSKRKSERKFPPEQKKTQMENDFNG